MAVNLHQLHNLLEEAKKYSATLVAVSKTKPVDMIKEVYDAGHKIFGENYVQELCEKQTLLPSDIEWHMIGHLQSNKVKYIAPFVKLIHCVDSLSLLEEINKQAKKNNRIINCLLQIYIANEETKFGLSFDECKALLQSEKLQTLNNICITGMMGMATNTSDENQIRKEFKSLFNFFQSFLKFQSHSSNYLSAKTLVKVGELQTLSMGMTSDYRIALDEGSSMIRIGSAIFGNR